MSDAREWLRQIRLFLFDLDGVLRAGKDDPRLVAGRSILPRLRELGLPYRIATNTTTHTRDELAESLRGLGLEVEPDEVHSVLETTVRTLQGRGVERCFVIGEQGLLRGLRTGGIEPVTEGAQAVLIGLDRSVTHDKILGAIQAVRAGALLLVCHRQRLYREAGRTWLNAGSVAAAVEFASGVRAEMTGKPAAAFFAAVLEPLAVPPDQAVMVGDSLESDVAGAARSGLRSVLVLSGQTSSADCEQSATRPDLVLEDADQLASLL